MASSAARRRFTTAEYERMAETGILPEDDRSELIAGEIIQMNPIGGRHIQAVNRLNRLLSHIAGEQALVSVQNPIRLSDDSEPQPDLTLLRDRDYVGEIPAAADVLLAIEVADSSLDYDRGRKLPLYAAAGISEAWLIDLAAGSVEDWSRESWRAARDPAYASLVGDPCGERPPGRPTLSEDKVRALIPFVRGQVVAGGLRLARLLDDALGPQARAPGQRRG